MQDHEHDQAGPAPERPAGRRADDDDAHELYRAGAAGRVDAMGPAGLLGLQRSVGNSGVGAMLAEERSPVHDVVGSGGSPLDADTRTDMEHRLGHDFGDVRVHTDGAAHDSAVSVGAHAYTVGPDIVFQREAYDPGSTAGRTTLAHELTHVVQQRSGPVDGSRAAGGIQLSDPADRFEREASATAEAAIAAPAGAAVQRAAAEEELADEAPVQGAFVQREAEEEAEAAEEPA